MTQRMANIWCTRCPIEGTRPPQTLYLSLDWEVSVVPLRVGWYRAIWVFAWITQERCVEPPILDLIEGGGGISPDLILWRGT
jgi:hypothetical protein